jgi:hypothetical protein
MISVKLESLLMSLPMVVEVVWKHERRRDPSSTLDNQAATASRLEMEEDTCVSGSHKKAFENARIIHWILLIVVTILNRCHFVEWSITYIE